MRLFIYFFKKLLKKCPSTIHYTSIQMEGVCWRKQASVMLLHFWIYFRNPSPPKHWSTFLLYIRIPQMNLTLRNMQNFLLYCSDSGTDCYIKTSPFQVSSNCLSSNWTRLGVPEVEHFKVTLLLEHLECPFR